MKPRLLDLYCGAGGAAMGYSRAGFEVVGVDISPQPHYPFPFVQADALEVLHGLVYGQLGGSLAGRFDAIHASPPCQAYTWATRSGREEDYPLLIAPTRALLLAVGAPYVIENVERAKPHLREPMLLCGAMFRLGVNRHRLFETSWMLWPSPGHPRCVGRIASGEAVTVAGHGGNSHDFRISRWREAMGIDWMTKLELVEAIPPAYTEWIGTAMLAELGAEAVVA